MQSVMIMQSGPAPVRVSPRQSAPGGEVHDRECLREDEAMAEQDERSYVIRTNTGDVVTLTLSHRGAAGQRRRSTPARPVGS